jgi:hypothetical protein
VATWVLGYAVGFFGGPIVHFSHAKWGIGFASFGARALGGPLLGALPGLIGYCAATGGVDDCAATGASWGLLGGLVAVDLFDGLVLARERPSRKKKQAYLPFLTFTRNSVILGGYLPL